MSETKKIPIEAPCPRCGSNIVLEQTILIDDAQGFEGDRLLLRTETCNCGYRHDRDSKHLQPMPYAQKNLAAAA